MNDDPLIELSQELSSLDSSGIDEVALVIVDGRKNIFPSSSLVSLSSGVYNLEFFRSYRITRLLIIQNRRRSA